MPSSTEAKQPKSTKANDDFFSEANAVVFNRVKFENVGDKIKGTYVGKYLSSDSKYHQDQIENYILVTEDGQKVMVSGRSKRSKTDPTRVMWGMEKVPFGAVIGFIYSGNKTTDRGEAHLIDLRYPPGEPNMEVYNAFRRQFNMEDVARATSIESEATSDQSIGQAVSSDPAIPNFADDGE